MNAGTVTNRRIFLVEDNQDNMTKPVNLRELANTVARYMGR